MDPSFSAAFTALRRVLTSASLPILVLAVFLSGCVPPQARSDSQIDVSITADGATRQVSVAAGSTAQQALEAAGVIPGSADLLEPPASTVLVDNARVELVRVEEVFEVNEVVIPFERRVVQNESLPEGETLLIQSGVNGTREITYRRVTHDGDEISNQEFKSVIIKEPVPEIMMVGVQAPFAALPIPGQLAYLTGGNAWLMNGSTGSRRPVITSADLDGRIFSVSPNGEWLLFTRKPAEPESPDLNQLWVVGLTEEDAEPIDLKVSNIIHYAGWVPGLITTIAYSTVEPRTTAPGWQANNDLFTLTFSPTGYIPRPKPLVESNSGGIYGWWGTNFTWSPGGVSLAYARPDSVGLVDLKTGAQTALLDLIPFQTRSNWAWVPGISWAPDASVLFGSNHLPAAGLASAEESPNFDLTALPLEGGPAISLVPQTGMFVYPRTSPALPEGGYWLAYLQAIFPDRSDTSNYRLVIADRDGSNPRVLFPPEGSPGLEPQSVVWSPDLVQNSWMVAVVYQGNLWLINTQTGEYQQVTGDGTLTKIDWQ